MRVHLATPSRRRWLDNHLGLAVGSRALDAFVAPLRAANVTFRAHAGAAASGGGATGDVGSLWTAGVGGQSVSAQQYTLTASGRAPRDGGLRW